MMSDDEFKGERLMPTKTEVGLLALLAVIVATPLLFGLYALVVVGVVLALAVLVVIALLARGGPHSLDGGGPS